MTVTHRTVRGVAVELKWAAIGRQADVVSVDGGEQLGTVAETDRGWVATRLSGLVIDHALRQRSNGDPGADQACLRRRPASRCGRRSERAPRARPAAKPSLGPGRPPQRPPAGLDAAFRAAGIGGRKPTFHELRHAHASAPIADGWDLAHASPNVTASFYSHEFEQAHRRDERRARLDGLYGSGTHSLRAV